SPLVIDLVASNPDGAPLTYEVDPPLHGTWTGVPPRVVYSPAPDYFGEDHFTYRVRSGALASPPALVSIRITPVNDPPVAHIQVSPLAWLTPGQTSQILLAPDNRSALVVLDGSRSFDVEDDPLVFQWFALAAGLA